MGSSEGRDDVEMNKKKKYDLLDMLEIKIDRIDQLVQKIVHELKIQAVIHKRIVKIIDDLEKKVNK